MTVYSNSSDRLRLHSGQRCVAVVIVLLFLLGGVASSVYSAPTPAIKKEHSGPFTPEQQYKAAKDSLLRLEQESIGKDRANWLSTARVFRSIHSAEKTGQLGPMSLYMTAKTYRRMFTAFKIPRDLDTALSGFLEVADLYPGHYLADDALLDAAECARQIPGKEALASDLYRKIIAHYPQGDQLERARIRLAAIEGEKSPAASNEGQPTVPVKDLASLAPVKYWSSDDYCRIVLQPTAPVTYTAKANTVEGGMVRRLSIDLAGGFIQPQYRTTLPVRDGLLKTIQPSQLSEETARISLDLHSLSDYTMFTLSDPFRIVVDIRGAGAANRSPHTVPPAPPAVAQPSLASPDTALAKKSLPNQDVEQAVVSLMEQKKRRPGSVTPHAPSASTKEKLSLAQQLGLGVRKIVIDPGHGGKDPGAMAFGLKEKDIVLSVAKKVARILKEHHRYEVVLTRTRDVFIPLEERTAIANAAKGDLFISIHVNAHSDSTRAGVETYFLNLATDANAMRVAAMENASSTHSIGELQDILATLMNNSKIDESTRLAQFVQTNLIAESGRSNGKARDLGVKQAPFFVLIGAEMPAILAEIAFLTNPEEAKLLRDETYLNKIAEQIAKGIVAYVDHHHTAAVKF